MNKFATINPHFTRVSQDDVESHEIARECESNLLEAYNFGDILKLVSNNWLNEGKAVIKLECGGNMYGYPVVTMTVSIPINEWVYVDEGEAFLMPVHRRAEMRFCGDGIIDMTLDPEEDGEQFTCCFDDHNWRTDDKRHLLNDLIDTFVEAYKKENERKDRAIGY